MVSQFWVIYFVKLNHLNVMFYFWLKVSSKLIVCVLILESHNLEPGILCMRVYEELIIHSRLPFSIHVGTGYTGTSPSHFFAQQRFFINLHTKIELRWSPLPTTFLWPLNNWIENKNINSEFEVKTVPTHPPPPTTMD